MCLAWSKRQCVGWLVKSMCSGLKEIQSIFLGSTMRVLWDELERIQKKVMRVIQGMWSTEEVWMVLGVCSRGGWRKTWMLKCLQRLSWRWLIFICWGQWGGRNLWQRCFWLDARRNPGKRLPGETVKAQSVRSGGGDWGNLSQKLLLLLIQVQSRWTGKEIWWGALPVLFCVDKVRMNTGLPPMLWPAIQVIGFTDLFISLLHSKSLWFHSNIPLL